MHRPRRSNKLVIANRSSLSPLNNVMSIMPLFHLSLLIMGKYVNMLNIVSKWTIRPKDMFSKGLVVGTQLFILWLFGIPGFPRTSLEKFQWFFNDISRQKSPISMIILNVTKWKNTGPHVTHGLLIHLMNTIGCFSENQSSLPTWFDE